MALHAAVRLAMAALQADASPALAAPIVAAFARLGAMASTVTSCATMTTPRASIATPASR